MASEVPGRRTAWLERGFSLLALALAVGFTSLILLLSGAPPIRAFLEVMQGSFGSLRKLSDVLVAWAPLLLSTSGLLITFSAGLWNIGIEGQITLGAIFSTAVLRGLQSSSVPPTFILALAILAGALGGALWGGLAGAMKTYGGVNEIFGGLGLNFVASAMVLWLIFGPWKRPGIGSMSGTEPFPNQLWLGQISNLRVAPAAILIAVAGIVVVYLLLKGTYFGLRLKAVGHNVRAAFITGIPTARYMMSAFLLCGAFAGIAGGLQVTAVYHRLIPSISSGYGFLGLLVAMLVNYQPVWAAPVALFFAALNIGSVQLPIALKLDSTLAGVMQGALVLFVVMMEGARRRLLARPGVADEP